MAFFVYLLLCSNECTYIGATVDLNRRLRQHNKEIKGGAKATGMRVARGETWSRVAHVSGFPTWQSALQFEWRWKNLTRKVKTNRGVPTLYKRIVALKNLLSLVRSTSKAIPFVEWSVVPTVNVEHLQVLEYCNAIGMFKLETCNVLVSLNNSVNPENNGIKPVIPENDSMKPVNPDDNCIMTNNSENTGFMPLFSGNTELSTLAKK